MLIGANGKKSACNTGDTKDSSSIPQDPTSLKASWGEKEKIKPPNAV